MFIIPYRETITVRVGIGRRTKFVVTKYFKKYSSHATSAIPGYIASHVKKLGNWTIH